MEKLFNVGVKGIIHTDVGYLILKKTLKNGNSFWDIPGGRIDGAETFHQTLIRELLEELPGIVIHSIGDLEGAFRVSNDIKPDTGLVLLYYAVEADFPNGEISFSDEHEDLHLVNSAGDIPKENINPVVVEKLERKLA